MNQSVGSNIFIHFRFIVPLGKNDPRVTPIEIFPDFKHTQKKKLPTYLQSVGGIGKSRQKLLYGNPFDPKK